jgi:hypothetical protein
MFLQGTDKRLAEAKVILPVHAVREDFNFHQFPPYTYMNLMERIPLLSVQSYDSD